MQRGPNSQSLQELIDSYNAEIMRYSQMARPAAPMPANAANQREAGEQARETGEEAAERGITERDYWLASGKQGLQRRPQAMPRPRPEPHEPLYRPGSHMPRPEPDEPLERPGEHHHRQPAPMPANAANQREAGEQARETGEEAAERGITERDYWLASGKQGLQRRPQAMPRPRPEPHEPLYRPGSHMPRPEPDEPLERPDEHHHKPAAPMPRRMDQPAVSANAPARSMTEQEMWMRELEQGLLELQRGLEDLAQGQRDLLAGQEAYRQGVAEREKWQQLAQPASAPSAEDGIMPPQILLIPSDSGAARHFDVRNAPSESPFAPQSMQMPSQNNVGAPPSGTTPQNSGINFLPSEQTEPQSPTPQNNFDPSQSNANAPITPISPENRTAQSAQSIPSDGMGMGYLQVGVYTARQSGPIPNARVTVFRDTPEGSELYASASTDDDGKIPLLQMPVGTSSTDGVNSPFAIYNVSVTADGYYPRNELQAQIFDGITALLWVELTPLPDTAWPPAGQ